MYLLFQFCVMPGFTNGVFGRFDLAALGGCHTLNVCCCCCCSCVVRKAILFQQFLSDPFDSKNETERVHFVTLIAGM